MSACRGCGKKIVWGRTTDGQRVPLDPAPPVYRGESELHTDGMFVVRDTKAMVSHFATCPQASFFSRPKKPKEKPPCQPPPHAST